MKIIPENKKTANEIGHLATNKITKMILITPHKHHFIYERKDGTTYGYSSQTDKNNDKCFWEIK